MTAPLPKRHVSLNAAAELTGVSRSVIFKLWKKGSIKGHYVKLLRQWRIDTSSLMDLMRRKGVPMPCDERSEVIGILVIGAPIEWCGEFSEHLPAGLHASYAATCFDAGRAFERERPRLAVIDFRLSRGDAIDLGHRLNKAAVRCLGLANEDEGEMRELRGRGFTELLRKPVLIPTVRDTLTGMLLEDLR